MMWGFLIFFLKKKLSLRIYKGRDRGTSFGYKDTPRKRGTYR